MTGATVRRRRQWMEGEGRQGISGRKLGGAGGVVSICCSADGEERERRSHRRGMRGQLRNGRLAVIDSDMKGQSREAAMSKSCCCRRGLMSCSSAGQ